MLESVFLIRLQAREGREFSYVEQLLRQTDKSRHQMCSIEKLSLNILQYLQKNTCVGGFLSNKFAGKRRSVVVICWTVTLSNWHKQSPKVFYEEDVLKTFTKFTGKHLENTQVWNFIKKRLQHKCFPINIAEFLRAPILKNISVQVFLNWLIRSFW